VTQKASPREKEKALATGKIKRLVSDRGFGFIQETGSAEDIFFHKDALTAGGFDSLSEGQSVEFDKGADPRNPGRSRAINVKLAAAGV